MDLGLPDLNRPPSEPPPLHLEHAHGRSRGRALFGVCASIAGIALSLSVAGAFTFGWPALGARFLAGDTDALLGVVASYTSMPLRLAAGSGALLYALGAVPLSVALW